LVGGSSWTERAAELGGSAKAAALTASETIAAKAAPKVAAAWEWVSPRVEEAWSRGITAAAPKVESAAKALAPRVDEARDLIVERALPAIVAAVDSAAKAATGAEIEAAKKARKRRTRRIVGWSMAAAAISAIAYWFWRQTRPVSDPWAEEDWEDVDPAPDEDLADAAGDAVEAVGEAAGMAVRAVADAARKAGDAVKKARGTGKKTTPGEAETADSPDES
jgi:hypothetical protein